MAASAKISAPQLPDVHPRPRLFDRFDQLVDRPVLWVSGPAGAGKTTAIASYLEARAINCGWYDIDAGDADPATFFHYLTRLCAERFGCNGPLPRYSPEYQAGLSVFARRFFEAFFGALPPGITLVFDNYNDLPAHAATHAILREAGAVIPPGAHLILASRGEPPSLFARSFANRRMARVGWDALRFSEEEASALVALRAPTSSISGADATQLHRLTDGWAAGMILVLESSATALPSPRQIDGHSLETIFEYFATEVLDGVDSLTAEVLLATACMPHVTEQAAETVTGLATAGAVLARLHRQNLFTTRRSLTPPVYAYHPLFRDFLVRQARERLSPGKLAQIGQRAAQALAAAGAPNEAMELLCRLGDWQTAIPVVLEHAPRLLATAQISTLRGWLAWLPDVAYQEPWLLYWKASALTVIDPAAGADLWRAALAAFQAKGDPEGALRAWAGAVHAIVLAERDLRQLDPLLADLDALMPAGAPAPTPEVAAKLAAAALIACTHREVMTAVPVWEARVRQAFLGAVELEQRIALGSTLLFCLTFVGNFDGAEELLVSLRYLMADVVDPLVRLQMLAAEAFLRSHNRRSGDGCSDIVDEGIRLSADSGLPLHREYLICYGLTSTVQKGDRAETERYLALAEQGAISERARGFFSWIRGLAALEFESAEAAIPWLERALASAQAIDYREGIGLASGGLACALLDRGQLAPAARALEQADGLNNVSPRARITVLLARAAFLESDGKPAAALEQFTAVIGLCRQYGLPTGGWLPRKAIARLCALAVEAGVETDFVLDTIDRRKLQPPPGKLRSRHWPWPIKIVAMGDFQLWFGRDQCMFQGKPPKMPLRLCKTLIATGGSAINAAQLAEGLWPDADGDLGRRTLDTTTHRLRKMLRQEGAVITSDGSLRLGSDVVFVDAFAVDPLVDAITDLIDRGQRAGTAAVDGLLDRLFALYGGPFLPGSDELPGVTRMRERLRTLFVKTVVRCGEGLEENRQPERALVLYDRGLAVEETSEPLYQRALTCHAALGQRAEATRLWHSCQMALERSLGVEPSRSTRRAFEQAV